MVADSVSPVSERFSGVFRRDDRSATHVLRRTYPGLSVAACGHRFETNNVRVSPFGSEPITCGTCRAIVMRAMGWSNAANRRRCELIDKDIMGGGLTEAEVVELADLTRRVDEYVEIVAPLPVEELEELERMIEELKSRLEGDDGE